MLLIAGAVNTISGIGAIGNSKFFVNGAKYEIGDLKTFGWIVMLLGIGQLLAAFGIMADKRGAAWAGVGFASLNAIAQLLHISSYPFLSVSLFALDIL